MLRYFLKRLISLALSLAVASLAIFFVIEVAPGDPASFMLGINAQPDTVAALRAELGLDVSKPERYLNWVGGMLVGDFGTSYTYRTPVAENDRRQALGFAPTSYLRTDVVNTHRISSRCLRCFSPWWPRRHCRYGRHAIRCGSAEFLVCHDHGADLRNQSALVFRRADFRDGKTGFSAQ